MSDHYYEVNPITIGHCTGLKDKDGRLVFEGDIVNYSSYANYNYQGIVCVGEYEQDGSGAEYGASKCYGVYIKRIKWIPHDWQDPEDEECCLPDYLCTESLLEVDDVEIIDNCWDNPELLHEEETA